MRRINLMPALLRNLLFGTMLVFVITACETDPLDIDTETVIIDNSEPCICNNDSNIYIAESITLQPGSEGFDAALIGYSSWSNLNYGNNDHFGVTLDGTWDAVNHRALLRFNLDAIDSCATIESAVLKLHFYQPSSWTESANKGPNNAVIKLVTESWDEQTVTYNSAPAVSDNYDVLTGDMSGVLATEGYVEIDITNLVSYWVSKPNMNYGMLMRLVDEVTRGSAAGFASSDNSNEELRPELKINYLKKRE